MSNFLKRKETTWFQRVNLLKPVNFFRYQMIEHKKNSTHDHSVPLPISCGSMIKQQLFPYTAITDWLLRQMDGVYWLSSDCMLVITCSLN
jgi:hypothetical protein